MTTPPHTKVDGNFETLFAGLASGNAGRLRTKRYCKGTEYYISINFFVADDVDKSALESVRYKG
jgi:hypothetical protein